ncbi:MAG TPA: tetratricopeptide repeat protein [Gemmatimonadaceae bacterium]|nr:tetratricopeptide repeat protein [Gemmatimonadaceae bacterium]
MKRYLLRVAPALALAAGTGCFATRSDLLVLQNDLAVTRAELLAADSARREQLDRVVATVSAAQDTLHSINRRFTEFQSGVRTSMENFGDQLIRVQSLLGVSQQQLQTLRADLERANRQMGTELPPTAGAAPVDSATMPPAGPPAAGTPGPAQLLESGRQAIQRGSPATGRAALEELVRSYPDDPAVPDALFYIGQAHTAEGDEAAADSAWVRLYTDFPESTRAAEAMYRHGVVLDNGGRTREARRVFQRVIDEYPRSDAAKLASDRLKLP